MRGIVYRDYLINSILPVLTENNFFLNEQLACLDVESDGKFVLINSEYYLTTPVGYVLLFQLKHQATLFDELVNIESKI